LKKKLEFSYIFTGGEAPCSHDFFCHGKNFSPVTSIIAADSGLETCDNYALKPSCIIGDMDSLNKKELLQKFDDVPLEKWSYDKDYSDTELALQKISAKNTLSVLIGAYGGRIDHFLGVYSLFSSKKPPRIWFCGNQVLYLIDGKFLKKISFENILDSDVVSVFPVQPNLFSKIEDSGLQWPLKKVSWHKNSISLSNRKKKNTNLISFFYKRGKFVVIVPLHAKPIFY